MAPLHGVKQTSSHARLYQVGVKGFQAVTYFIKGNTKTDKTQNMG
jgi:hypothetical protein